MLVKSAIFTLFKAFLNSSLYQLFLNFFFSSFQVVVLEYGIFEEGPQISTNQKRENTAFSLLIGRNMRPFPKITVLYKLLLT